MSTNKLMNRWEEFVDDNNQMVDVINQLGWGKYPIMELVYSEWKNVMICTLVDKMDVTFEIVGVNVFATDNITGIVYDITDHTIHHYIKTPSGTIH